MNDEELDRAIARAADDWTPDAAMKSDWISQGHRRCTGIRWRRRAALAGVAALVLFACFMPAPVRPAVDNDPVYADLATMILDLEIDRTSVVDLTDIDETLEPVEF